ncbi:hypothetical protein IG631_19731 [Alternaria alternata]|nr:hypothetical protein IG631_19731 [Alternaria alternata]
MERIMVNTRKFVNCLGADLSRKRKRPRPWGCCHPTTLNRAAGHLTSIPRVPNLRISAELPEINTMTP